MIFNQRLVTLGLLSSLCSIGFCNTPPVKEQLIVSQCMLKHIKNKAQILTQSQGFAVIDTVLDDAMLETLHQHAKPCGKFINLDAYSTNSSQKLEQLLMKMGDNKPTVGNEFPKIIHDAQVQELYKLVDPGKIWQTNQHLTGYLNRSAKTQTGVDAANWFKDQFDHMALENKRQDVESYLVKTGNKYIQPSVVTKIGTGKTGKAIVIGAHIDTLSGNMPGADDDASGISVELEIARVLLTSEIQLDQPVYIIAYAAEERGLVGSSYVVKSFLENKTPVKAVMQLDQAGYRANPQDNTIWLIKDHVDNKLTQFTAELLSHYLKIPVGYSACNYACSDHVNWTNKGFSACYPSATTLDNDNPYIHTAQDSLTILNLDHQVNFTKLGLAFVAELGLK